MIQAVLKTCGVSTVAVHRIGHRHPCRGAEADSSGANDAEDQRQSCEHNCCAPECWRRRRSSSTLWCTSRDDATPWYRDEGTPSCHACPLTLQRVLREYWERSTSTKWLTFQLCNRDRNPQCRIRTEPCCKEAETADMDQSRQRHAR